MLVGNLSDDTTQKDLEDIFFEVGQVVEISLQTDQSSGRPKGFAFVEFTDRAGVAAAIEKLDGHELNGRNISVSADEDQPQRSTNSDNQGNKSWQKRSKSSKSKGSRRNVRAKKRGG